MMIFRELKADAQGEPQVYEAGRMGLKPDGHLWAKGSPFVLEIAQRPLELTFGGSIDPCTNAKEFLANLPDRYHGTYFWVEEAPDEPPSNMIVDLYSLGDDGTKLTGSIILDKDGLRVTGDSKHVREIFSQPLRCYDEDKHMVFMVDPKADPERFVKELPNVYHGTYFWAVERDGQG